MSHITDEGKMTVGTDGKDHALPMKKIVAVCTLDAHDEETLKAAANMARAHNAQLTVMAVVDIPPEIVRMSGATGISRKDIEDSFTAEYRKHLSRLTVRHADGLDPRIEIRNGKPFLEVIKYTLAHGTDMVIKTAEESKGLHRYFFTSMDQHLLRKCPCPVWLRVNHDGQPVKTVLAAVDLDIFMNDEADDQSGLNRLILESASRIAQTHGAALHVLHVWDAPGETSVRLWSDAPDGSKAADNYVRDIRRAHENAFDRLIEEAAVWTKGGKDHQAALIPHLKRGIARSVIPEHVRNLGADTLVIGTIARTGVPGFFIGNTAEDVLNSVDCSVVTVKPPHYVSPVEPD